MWMNILFLVISVVTLIVVFSIVEKAEESDRMARVSDYSTNKGFAILFVTIAFIAIAVMGILWLFWFA